MLAEGALFLAAFGGATLLPLSSEAAFIAALASDMPLANAMFFASSGNILAIILNYFLGYFLYEKTLTKLHASSFGKRAYAFGHQWGYATLLLSWLPLIGDPLTLVAGLLRLNFFAFVLIAGGLRIARYAVLALMV